PTLIRALGRELLLQHVVGDRLIVIAVGGDLVAFHHAGFQLLFLHQPDDPLAADVLAPFYEVVIDARAAVVAAPAFERRVHQYLQSLIFLRAFRDGTRPPGIE